MTDNLRQVISVALVMSSIMVGFGTMLILKDHGVAGGWTIAGGILLGLCAIGKG